MPSSKRRFELVDDKSRKFWEIWIDGPQVHTAYGRIGTGGQTTVKTEASDAAAEKLAAKLVREKTGKGYLEVTAVPSVTPAGATSVSADVPEGNEIEARIVRGVDGLADEEKRELIIELWGKAEFSDARLAVRAFRWALDHQLSSDDVDGDTVTRTLIRMIGLTPDDDALLLEYLRAVADSDYAYADRRLGDLAVQSGISPARAKRLALGATFVEGWCLEVSRTRPTPPAWLANALRSSFALALRLGASASDWHAMRSELMVAHIASEGRPDAGEWALWTAPA